MASNADLNDRAIAAELCTAFRHWAPEESTPPIPLRVLEGGYSNRNLLLGGAAAMYVLRIGDPNPPPGVDRGREAVLATAAAERGLAPPVLFCDIPRGLMITRYVGKPESAAASAASLAALLRAIHQLPMSGKSLGKPLSSAEEFIRWRDVLPDSAPTRTLLEKHQPALVRGMRTVTRTARGPVVCHNDLLTANRRRWKGRLIALDWEYAAVGDPLFDLAVCASEFDTGSFSRELLSCYLQRSPNASEKRCFDAQLLMASAITACWYERQQPGTVMATNAQRQLQMLLDAPSYSEAPL